MAYLLDANVFIQAKNLHYGFDFCPAFWDWLAAQNQGGQVFSIEKVEDELVGLGDDLSQWAQRAGTRFFLRPDADLIPALRQVALWASGRTYEPAAVRLFLQVADSYLIAHALAHGDVVVTHEVSSASTKKIKIPDACLGLGVKCMTPFQMVQTERALFMLGKQA
jgi:hypothetical protein